jgi:hypothetical protein
MTPQLITASYSETLTVSFTTEAWFDATQVAKSFNKQPKEWLRLNSTIEYIDQLIEFQRGENPTFDKNQLVIVKKGSSENGGGTWFHPKLAVPFARWLEARFAVWCDVQIEKILQSNSEPANFPEFLNPITEPITLEDFNWRHQVISSAFQNLQNAKVILTFNGSELLVGTRLAKTKRLF